MGNSAGAITTIIGITYYLNIIFKPALDRSFQLQAQRMKIQLLRSTLREKNPKSRKAAQGKLEVKICITEDSGAGNSVMPRKAISKT